MKALVASLAVLLAAGLTLGQGPVSSSALLAQAMDSRRSELRVQGGLVDVMKGVEAETGLRMEADPAVWEVLPWGQETSLTVHLRNCTVREALETITRRLGLTFSLGEEAVELTPSPPLARLGRRSTLEEIQVLDRLAATPAGLAGDATVQQVLNDVDGKLVEERSPFAVQDRLADPAGRAAVIHIARNATLMEALEEIPHQTDATWYPWGHSLVITSKVDATRLLLSKRVSRQFHDEPLPQVLTDLEEASGVAFSFSPGVLQRVPEKYQRLTLRLDDATVEEALQMISAATGLEFTTTGEGVGVGYAAGIK
jgi:hypothetical protein